MSDKFLLLSIVLFSLPTFAQFQMSAQMSGTGYWGGTQGCAYQQKAAPGASSEDDGISEIQAQITEVKKQLATKKREKKRLDRDADRNKSDIEKSFADDYSSFLEEHIESARRCDEYKGLGGEQVSAGGDEGGKSVNGPSNTRMISVRGFSAEQWGSYCDANKVGSVFGGVCDNSDFRPEGGRVSSQICKKALTDYRSNYAKAMKAQDDIETLTNQLARLKDDLADAKQDASDNRQANEKANTEGGVCTDCITSGNGYTYQQPQTDWANVISNVGTGLAAMYMGYQSNKVVSDNNASIGYPTMQQYPTWGYGLPYLAQGLYGALGGSTGQGGFGCGGSSSMAGGAFGYPSSMMGMNTMGGGIFPGMNGMMGSYMGSMYPGMGGMGMMNSYMGGMMSGMSGMYSGGMMGSMMGGMGMMNSYMGGMMGNMSSGMYSGSMMSAMMNGMMSGIVGSYMGNYMGSYMGNSMMSGMMNSYMGNMMSSYMGSYSGGYDQSSLQMMQMQMQYQQQYQQQQYSKYSSMMSLQQEISSLMYKMQLVQMGYGSSSTGYISGSSSSSSLPSGTILAPNSSSYSTYSSSTSGVILAPTTGTTTIYGR